MTLGEHDHFAGRFITVMRTDVATFATDGHDPATVVARLTKMGFEFGPSRVVTRSLLDTFDRRLYSADLRLELREGDGLELILTGEDSAAAHLVVSSVPRFPDDLPPGPFRARIAAVADVRALLPVVRVTATRSAGLKRNRAGKIVATATMYEHVRIADDNEIARCTFEVDELEGYAKPASKARDALAELGLTRLDGDTLTVAAAAAGARLAGASGPTSTQLDPMMPAVAGFRTVLAELGDAIEANWQGTIDRIDPEFLHDLRVAVRRTRSVLSEGKKVLPPLIVGTAEERFGWLGGLTGPARDLDSHLLNWASDTSGLADDVVAALEGVHVLLERRSDAAHETLARALQSAEAADLLTTAAAWWREPALDIAPGVHAERPLGKVVSKRIARAHANLVEHGRMIDADSPPEQVHDLRKDAKRLRYLLECFAGVLHDAPRKAFVRRLKAFQDNLGEHHDAAVHVAELRAISDELHVGGASSETMVAIGRLIARLDQRRIATRLEFAEHFAAYDTKATQRDLDAALPKASR
jgi:CHAD domain-containing protein